MTTVFQVPQVQPLFQGEGGMRGIPVGHKLSVGKAVPPAIIRLLPRTGVTVL